MTVATRADIRDTIVQLMRQVAPEIDPATLDPALDLRDQVDMDSMDFLNLVISIHERFGVDIPEIDYADLTTLDGFVAYVAARLPTA